MKYLINLFRIKMDAVLMINNMRKINDSGGQHMRFKDSTNAQSRAARNLMALKAVSISTTN